MTTLDKTKLRTVKRPRSANLGGSRDGAGRKPIFAKPMHSISLALRPEDFAFLKARADGGSISEGLRRLLDDVRKAEGA